MNRTSKRILAVGLPLAAVSLTGIAFAAWTSTGSGSGTAQSTTSENSVVSGTTHPADLYPGATKSVTVTITNPNDYPILVTSIPAGTSDVVGGCAANTVTTSARALDATGLFQADGTTKTIAARGSGVYTLASHMIADASDACKSATFNLPIANATVVSNAS